jgi:hypothetical protein
MMMKQTLYQNARLKKTGVWFHDGRGRTLPRADC